MGSENVDIVSEYQRLLRDDPDMTMPVAAIEALIHALAHHPATTVSETLDLVSKLTARLKSSVSNSISLSAGSDLFQQYLVASLQRPNFALGADTNPGAGTSEFDQVRAHLVQNGKLFAQRAKAARATIAQLGRRFVRDGDTVLTFGGSRVVGTLLRRAASGKEENDASITGKSEPSKGNVRFRVIYVVPTTTSADSESAMHIAALRALDIPVATIPPTAIAYCLDQVTQCFVGAEGVVENGGIISRMGTYQLGILAKAAGKPFYIVCETHKFVRLYPLSQRDLGLSQNVVDFKTTSNDGTGEVNANSDRSPRSAYQPEQAVDYTPPSLITGIITESGVLLPSAVSEELIKIWF